MSKLIALSIIKNEYNNYLIDWLDNVSSYADYHIMVDDASDDGKTVEFIEEKIKKGYKGELHKLNESLFKKNEVKLRSILWDYARKYAKEGDWIIVVDADEFYDDRIIKFKKKYLAKNKIKNNGISINWLDMWDENHFRVDGRWSPINFKGRICKFKDLPFVSSESSESPLHKPALPEYMNKEKYYRSNIPMIHKGYLDEEKRKKKYIFYKENVSDKEDPKMYKHALSICNKKAVLFKYPTFRRNYLCKINKILKKLGIIDF